MQITQRVVADLANYPTWDVQTMLNNFWPLTHEANPEAVLRSIIGSHLDPEEAMMGQGWDAPTWADIRRVAIQRFIEVQPSQRRALLLDN
jgi:hypothetical protein